MMNSINENESAFQNNNIKNTVDKIIWSEDFSVGCEALDEQHKKIVELINILIVHHNASVHSETIAYVINELMLYSLHHLEYEEILLKELQYPEFSQHKEDHSNYKGKVGDIVLKVSKDNKETPVELLEFLQEWWSNHILKEDMAYKPFLENYL